MVLSYSPLTGKYEESTNGQPSHLQFSEIVLPILLDSTSIQMDTSRTFSNLVSPQLLETQIGVIRVFHNRSLLAGLLIAVSRNVRVPSAVYCDEANKKEVRRIASVKTGELTARRILTLSL